MAAILTPSTAPTSTRSNRTRRSARPAMPTLPFPEPTASESVIADRTTSVIAESFFDSVAASIEGATARALHPAVTHSVSPTDPTVEIARPMLTGLAAHGRFAADLSGGPSAGSAPWNLTAPRDRSSRHLHVVRDVVAPSIDVTVAAPMAAPVVRAARGRLRSIVAGVVLALVIAFAAIGALQFFGAAAAATTPAATTEPFATTGAPIDAASAVASAPVAADAPARHSIVVQRGESLWTVARRIQPTGDLRQLVDALIERNGGVTVEAGQRLDLTGLVD